jgi:hypothetical protein
MSFGFLTGSGSLSGAGFLAQAGSLVLTGLLPRPGSLFFHGFLRKSGSLMCTGFLLGHGSPTSLSLNSPQALLSAAHGILCPPGVVNCSHTQ